MTPAEKPPQSRTVLFGLLLAVAALVFFAWLADEVVHGRTQQFDDRIRMLVHARSSPALTAAMRGVSMIGEPWFLFVLGVPAVVWFVWKGWRRTVFVFAITVAGAEVIDQLLKLMFHRPRPATFFSLTEPVGYSFPSGHALVSCAFFGGLAVFAAARTGSRARRCLYYILAALLIAAIGYSRIYLGAHYPSDVAGGYAAAVVWLFSVAWVRR
jgi:undecaprenyl-diphosphatase